MALRIRYLGLVFAAFSGCYGGQSAGEGASCEEPALPCRQFFACVSGRCVPAPASSPVDSGMEVSEAGPADAPVIPDADPPKPDLRIDATPADTADTSSLPGWYEPAVPPRVFVLTVTAGGGLWLQTSNLGSLFVDEPPWTEPKDLQKIVGQIGAVEDAAIQTVGSELTIIARTGTAVQETRLRGGVWSPWTVINDNAASAGLANVEGRLYSCLVTSTGVTMIGTRQADDRWTFEPAPPGALFTFRKIDCTGLGAGLEIVALDDNGRLYHSARKPDSWPTFSRVTNATDLSLIDVDATASTGSLHVFGSSRLTQYHAARAPDGVWATFRDVEMAGGRDPDGMVVAGAETSAFTEVLWFQVNSLGQLWLSIRFRYPLAEFERIDGPSATRPGIVNVAATVGLVEGMP